MEVEELVYKAIKASGEESIRGFAKRLDVSHTAVGQWIKGDQIPTFEQAAELAKMAGLPVVSTAASIRMKSKDGAKHKALLRQLAATAALLAVVVLPALPRSAQAATGWVQSRPLYALCEMKWWGELFALWLRTRFGKPRGPSIEAKSC